MLFHYGVDDLNPDIVIKIARDLIRGKIDKTAKQNIQKSFNATQVLVQSDSPIYAINTGFGSLCTTKISLDDREKLQENLLLSHSVGVGNPISPELAKMIMILKIQALCMGYSGVSLDVVERIKWHVEENVLPRIPEQGSVGASGDLCPLSHCFLPLINHGELTIDEGTTYLPTSDILAKYKKTPLHLHAKEGLALNNGTQFMTAHGVYIVDKLRNCINHANLVASLSIEAYLASIKPMDARIHIIRPHPGAIEVAAYIRNLLQNSEFQKFHESCDRVQDPYSFRCVPQVHGAVVDALNHFEEILIREINSVTDNPIIFSDTDSISGGNFHGEPIALPMDYVGLAASELGNISDRRIYLLLHGQRDLPQYLIQNSGINSGFMIVQYCTAALVSENKSLCFPASADSIPTSLGQEDHVSMGSISARKTLKIIDNLEKIIAIELLCALQALDFRSDLKSTPAIEKVRKYVRESIPFINQDTELYPHIDRALEIVRERKLMSMINS
jgi:histidine ammonia-lyase